MTSAGSFVHGTDGRRKSTDEEDIANFLSSMDEITSHAAAGSENDGDRNGVGLRGAGSPGGLGLFFGSASSPAKVTSGHDRSLLLETEEGVAEAVPEDWVKDLEALQIVGDKCNSSAEVRTPSGLETQGGHLQHERLKQQQQHHHQQQQQQQQQQHQQQQQQQQQSSHEMADGEEVLGLEPEILDEGDGDIYREGISRSPTPVRSNSASSRIGPGTRSGSSGTQAGLGNGERLTRAAKGVSVAEKREQPLDWPGTLDMLGIRDPGNTTPAKNFRATASLPNSELPSMPPPSPRDEKTFPDFVEVRDTRLVSQFPKPKNILVSKVASAQDSNDGGTGEGAGDDAKESKAREPRPQVVLLPAPLRTVEVYLRPDVTWEAVSDVYMAVMLSRGLVVRHETAKSVTAEKVSEGSSDWTTVKLTAGVTRDKLRTLVIQFYSETRPPILSLAGAMARFSGRAGDDLYSAIRDALVERRMPLSFLATDASGVSLDPHYVRDLVGMYAHENMVNLTRYALPLEEYVQGEEERSARLEATLLPQYRAYGLTPPRPTRSKPLSAYPLTTRRLPVSSCGVKEAVEVIERAREHVGLLGGASLDRKEDSGYEADGSPAEGDDGVDGEDSGRATVAEGIRSLIRATWENVKEWCDEEAEARVRRKDSQVRDRLLAVERHREALVTTLRDGVGGAAAYGSPIGREFAARFRPMAGEAVLCYCSAAHAKRVGQLYLTSNHLCFHSSVLGFISQRVLPLLTVASVSHSTVALGMDVIVLTDRGREAHAFGITSVEAGFPGRFHDLIQQCLILCKEEASRRAEKDGNSAPEEPDEEQILARVQRLAIAKQRRQAREAAAAAAERPAAKAALPAVSSPSVTPAPRHPPSPVTARLPSPQVPPSLKEIDNKDNTAEPAGSAASGRIVEGGARETPRSEYVAGTKEGTGSERGSSEEETKVAPVASRPRGGGVGGSFRGGSMMAMGIQAFLEESQKKS